eukprot:TRINITY_DN27185_c0_g1_i1.p4 TRINITY_DN27185_c0_g1~~TRINITY_DN27185_c0_g1_i1.p4  ORF type:complete len:112 (-),score=19.80 TRINITY_DN27185_c0_g1_i1:107-442(-)
MPPFVHFTQPRIPCYFRTHCRNVLCLFLFLSRSLSQTLMLLLHSFSFSLILNFSRPCNFLAMFGSWLHGSFFCVCTQPTKIPVNEYPPVLFFFFLCMLLASVWQHCGPHVR